MHTDHGKAFFSKPLQMPNGLDSRLRGNDGSFITFEYCCYPKVWIPALYDALYQRGALLFLTF
ncbi:TPA: hypothetical protein ACLA0H_002134, partial [Neisseria meningitidis]